MDIKHKEEGIAAVMDECGVKGMGDKTAIKKALEGLVGGGEEAKAERSEAEAVVRRAGVIATARATQTLV